MLANFPSRNVSQMQAERFDDFWDMKAGLIFWKRFSFQKRDTDIIFSTQHFQQRRVDAGFITMRPQCER